VNRTVFALALALLPTTAAAADHPAEPDSLRVGIGVTAEMLASLGYLGYLEPEFERLADLTDIKEVRAPILFPNTLRLEPAIKYLSLNADGDEFSFASIRVSVAKGWVVGPNASAYGGGRVGLVTTDDGDDSTSDALIGGLVGGEYWIGKAFSLGAEVNLDRVQFDKTDFDATAISIGSSLNLRFYFN
jgi:hypothetical protein